MLWVCFCFLFADSFGVENGDLSVSPAAAADDNKEVFSPLCSSILNGIYAILYLYVFFSLFLS